MDKRPGNETVDYLAKRGRPLTYGFLLLAAVEHKIIDALEGITVDPELCQIALDNICEDLDSQTGKVQSLYVQQNDTLGQLELQLGKLADM